MKAGSGNETSLQVGKEHSSSKEKFSKVSTIGSRQKSCGVTGAVLRQIPILIVHGKQDPPLFLSPFFSMIY